MSIIVQKFGGTSVADSQKILSAARRAIRAKNDGHQVVMVVSAMGQNTDLLVALASQISDHPPAREMDMLLSTGEQVTVALMAMAIDSLGHEAVSMTGGQVGIRTDSTHTKARIHSIATERLHAALDSGKLVIAAGFQGVDESSNITTLGRGGSDTTAVALAAALGADACEIYTDVDGVYTTDPRLVPEARRASRISYDEMLELASLGAGVMHNRAIEFAKRFGVPVHVRSSFSDQPGTLITSQPESKVWTVAGAALVKDEAWVTVQGVPDRPGAASTIFSKIAGRRVAMDMIVQNVADEGHADISFSVVREDLAKTLKAVEEACKELGAGTYTCDDSVSKVSVVGLGMATQTGVAEKMFRGLAEKGINILMITTSEIKISVLVARDYALEALRTVHGVFELSSEPPAMEPIADLGALASAERDRALARLEGMEDLIIDEIALDVSQARITLPKVPDTPGMAAQVFDEVAENGIVVDMIVQSIGRGGQANLSFTVAKEDLARTMDIARSLAEGFQGEPPTSSPEVAKLAVSGIGMRSHTSVAQRMFQSLAAAGINVDMISTSEVRMNVVVDGRHGHKALEVLQGEFREAMA
ncbi:MAG: aspartate kinase [Pirellulales bacterium]|jgi:aspartate kinase|nr:aspartate kinase [Thermoguttaceae bacterium]MDD4786755.1 aspartate kinase [Pirellulales bacterium]MDI9444293.1 aspartate kinase [Planctomycetota bacterium]NLY99863.1 aspartate kinase [Pirellulaceae bacterium]